MASDGDLRVAALEAANKVLLADNGELMDHQERLETENAALRSSGGARPQDGVFSLTVPFSKGIIAVQVKVTGDAISPAHLARVRRYLELAEKEWDGDL